ncbi:MAG: thiamine pyrophosphate-binding protein [Acidobacteria bacterium]|nr:thiamine pyrophosphate-binding protein [Acidobacteriota bacterium]
MTDMTNRHFDSQTSHREMREDLSGHALSATPAETVPYRLETSKSDVRGPQDSSWTVEGSGGELVVAQARAAGVEYVFANPGSFESGLFDALTDVPAMHVILGLHEGIVLSMADGYHRVTGKPGFVNVHAVVGTAQMLGQLYNAWWDGSALVVTAGLLDSETGSDEVLLAAPPGFSQKEIARPFTKMCWDAREPGILPLMLRRALKVAMAEPSGPVYLAMKDSALESKDVRAEILPAERFLLTGRARPAKAAVELAARMVVESMRPLVVVGDDVWKAGAQPELLAFSEQMGLPVADQVTAQAEMVSKGLAMDSPFRAFHSFPVRHPHYLGNFRANSEWMKRGVDLLVCIGCRDFGDRAVVPTGDVPAGARVIRIGTNTSAMGRNYPTDVALVGDIKEALNELLAAIGDLLTTERRETIAGDRSAEITKLTSEERALAQAAAQKNFGQSPIHPDEIAHTMAAVLDHNAVIVCENPTAAYKPFSFGFRENEQMHISTGGASLGWGVGAATGAKLGAPDRQVVCYIGDGALMYSASGFWTQARYNIPVLTVVANNYNYQTVRLVYHGYQGKMAATGHYAGTYLGEPGIDFVALAGSQGVRGEKVDNPQQLEPALERGKVITQEGKPYLIEVATARCGPGAESVWHEKFALRSDGQKR